MRNAVLILSLLVSAIGGCARQPARNSPAANGVAYPVFFTPFSANIDDPARSAIATAAQSAKDHPGVPVLVSGYAAPPGSPQVNLDLSRTRAQNVSDTLVADGVAASRITTKAKGMLTDLNDPIEGRRVDISVGG